MGFLIKAELCKLRKSIGYKIMLAGVVLYALVDIYFDVMGIYGETNVTGFNTFFGALAVWGRCLLFSGIFAGLFIANDFNNRVMQMKLAVGNSRLNVILSKSLVYLLGCMSFSFIYHLVYIGGVCIFKGFGAELSGLLFLCFVQLMLGYYALYGGLVMVCLLIAFLFRDIFVVTTIEVVVVFFGTTIINTLSRNETGILKSIIEKTAVSQINQLAKFAYEPVVYEHTTALELMAPDRVLNAFSTAWNYGAWPYIGTGIVTGVLLLGIACLIFNHAELK